MRAPISIALALLAATGAARAQDFDARGQATYVWQDKPSFRAPYSGANSLLPQRELSYSFTATAFLGWRAWKGGEIYFNPEVTQGVPLSRLAGLGGFTNGEIQRTAGPNPRLYRARLFLRQTWGFGGGSDKVEADANQLAGAADRRRLVLTAGNIAVGDLFDDNAYSHDARTQFLNWSLVTHGAYDFAADARGYTWGAALEYFHDAWAVRAGRFMMPQQSNGLPLDSRIMRHYGDQAELEHAHEIAGRPGKIRLLAYRNVADMGSFREALDAAAATGGTPDLTLFRQRRAKVGAGINLEQSLTESAGVFLRASRHDGKTETFAFTEIDRSLSGGLRVQGSAWKRAGDSAGLAFARNGLSADHRDYLAAGGLGFFLGDGRLNYRPENIAEAFYSLGAAKGYWFTVDWQRIRNPGYNADRGPVTVASLRFHAEF